MINMLRAASLLILFSLLLASCDKKPEAFPVYIVRVASESDRVSVDITSDFNDRFKFSGKKDLVAFLQANKFYGELEKFETASGGIIPFTMIVDTETEAGVPPMLKTLTLSVDGGSSAIRLATIYSVRM
ncbi:hypothetical protein [Pararhizobium sp.]|uniref:hypothetical protein n=1 Tax=Pararhizobium sp. TaxID=1977563 RepID=UPI002720DD78|nr:hypothetical protein [Pararhizobium sp.]MDO9416416.1 hypothetical protein [Pararhizobium sp.]